MPPFTQGVITGDDSLLSPYLLQINCLKCQVVLVQILIFLVEKQTYYLGHRIKRHQKLKDALQGSDIQVQSIVINTQDDSEL